VTDGAVVGSGQLTVELACAAFGLAAGPRASITAVSRGATGRIWRLDLGGRQVTGYAVKQLLFEPDEASVDQETAFTAHLAAAGIRLPRSLPSPGGRYVVPFAAADGTGPGWLRLYEWIDGAPADLADPGVADRIGDLLGRLHARALPPQGPVDPWYETTPPPAAWDQFAGAGLAQRAGWAQELTERAALLRVLAGLVAPAARDRLVTCHRDLHPGNVLADRGGALVPLDWDDAGPADPGQELAGLLMFWHADDDGGAVDEAAVGRTLRAYYAAGGHGELRDEMSFGMYLAGRLNFLHGQASLALDPSASGEDRAYASAEVSDTLARLPTLTLLSHLLRLS
jgi:Ser/Thr protein kinase RdoA (MazF antagonist)